MVKKCKALEGCGKRPAFDIDGGKGTFCSIHKMAGMLDVRNKRCAFTGCDKQPAFNIEGGKGTFCSIHKTKGMLDVKTKRCAFTGCDKINPGFNIEGGKGTFCSIHKMAGMVDVKTKRCAFAGCDKQPAFNLEGGKATFCFNHKTKGMIDVKTKRCAFTGCDSLNAAFNIEGGKGTFCFIHKTKEMLDVKTKRCAFTGCDSLNPAFNIDGGKGTFCSIHKTKGMIDVRTKRCAFAGCGKGALYGKPGLQKSHCATHRPPGMIRRPNAKCEDCKELAIWGMNLTPLHCDEHKTAGEQNLVERTCISCQLVSVLDKNDRCDVCDPETFKRARLAKQNALMAHLDWRGLPGNSTDTTVDGGACGLERPDRVYDFGDKIVILECDEYQHRDRQCLCEQNRMVNIGQSFGGLPVYFLRWNPDSYQIREKRKRQEEEPVAVRHKLVGDLLRDIQEGRECVPPALVAAKYLYYKGWKGLALEEWHILSALE